MKKSSNIPDPLGIFKGLGRRKAKKGGGDGVKSVNQPLSASQIWWSPNPGPQTAILMRSEFELGMGGRGLGEE